MTHKWEHCSWVGIWDVLTDISFRIARNKCFVSGALDDITVLCDDTTQDTTYDFSERSWGKVLWGFAAL